MPPDLSDLATAAQDRCGRGDDAHGTVGLEDGQIRTLEEVGKAFGVTRERIRQIESKTLAKLRRREVPRRSAPAWTGSVK